MPDLLREIWELDLPHAEAWLLIALLTHMDHKTNETFVGVRRLAWSTGYERRAVSRLLRHLEELGGLTVVGRRPMSASEPGATIYRIDLSKFPRKIPFSQGSPGRPQKTHDKLSWVNSPRGPGKPMTKNHGLKSGKHMAGSHGFTEKPMTFSTKTHDIDPPFFQSPPDPPYKEDHHEDHVVGRHATHEHDTHTCAPAERKEVCVAEKEGKGSRFDQETCLRYAEFLHDLDQGIKYPKAFARSIFKSGEADADIELFTRGKLKVHGRRREPGLDVGKNSSNGDSVYTKDGLMRFIDRCSVTLLKALTAKTVIARADECLQQIKARIGSAPNVDIEALERELESVDQMLLADILGACDRQELHRLETEARAELKKYAGKMEKKAYDHVIKASIARRVRERFKVPRLSLFYYEGV